MNNLKIEYKKIEDLNPYKNNPRINDEAVEDVANSIKEFGFKVPIILDKNNVIVAGHTRYKASKQLELIDEELVTLRNYYNGNIATYNKMIKKFPTLIIARIKKYNERPFYDLKDQTDDDYEDFKL